MVTITKASKLTGLSVKAIRHYESIGLASPSVRTEAGYRIYLPEDLARLRKIRYYRELGFSLQEIPSLLSAPEAELQRALEKQRLRVQKEIEQRERALATLNAVLSRENSQTAEDGVAVISIDLQNDITENGALACKRINRILPCLKQLFACAREKHIPVIYICDWHLPDDEELLLWNDHMIAGTWGSEIIPEVAPQDGDIIIHKNRFNGFVNTDLQATLDALNIRTIIMSGWRTDVCVAQTAIEAFYRGYQVVLAEDGMDSTSQTEHNSGMTLMRVNYAFECYPCRDILDNVMPRE